MSRPSLTDHDELLSEVAHLARTDPVIASQVAAHGPPPPWSRPPGFATVVLLVLEQRVSLASAAATFARLVDALGSVDPDTVLGVDVERLRELGIPRQKAGYLHAVARAVADASLDLDALAAADDDQVREALTALPGIGPWTADVYLLACLGRPDVWPVGDRALQVAAGEALHLPEPPDQTALLELGERWRPLRSVAARVLWHGYLERRGRGISAGDDTLAGLSTRADRRA